MHIQSTCMKGPLNVSRCWHGPPMIYRQAMFDTGPS